MSGKKKSSDIFFLIFLIVFCLLFVFFLTQIPNFINEDSKIDKNIYYSNIKSQNNNPNELVENTKYEFITNTIMTNFNTLKVKDSYNDYIIDLTISNKVVNRENTIAQEVLSLYLKNQTDDAKLMSKHFIIDGLNKYDEPINWKWRNHLLILNDGDNEVFLFNQSSLLKSYENATMRGEYVINVSVYKYQRFYLTFPDGFTETITLNIFTGESDGNLNEYIDINYGNKPRVDLRSIKTELIKSDEKYSFKLLIWK